MSDECPDTFPDELFVVEQEVEYCSHMGHPDLIEATQQTSMAGRWMCKYRRIGAPFEVDMQNRQQHRVVDPKGKAMTRWTTWEGND